VRLERQNADRLQDVAVPWLTWAVIGFIVRALGVMIVMPQHRLEVSLTLGWRW
jgi:L-asparagine transporter-like permease